MHTFKTINLKGKPYVEVKERIKYFRTAPEYKGWSMLDEIVEKTDTTILIKTTIYDESNTPRATGMAYEIKGNGLVNKTSHVENCGTSAWGRALANLGIGIDQTIASAEEMSGALLGDQQAPKVTQPQVQTIPPDLLSAISGELADCHDIKSLEVLAKKYSKDRSKYAQINALFTAKKLKVSQEQPTESKAA